MVMEPKASAVEQALCDHDCKHEWVPLKLYPTCTNCGAEIRRPSIKAIDARPSGPVQGDVFFDTTINELKLWNGSNWVVLGIPPEGFVPPR